jgi:hypothetical protein
MTMQTTNPLPPPRDAPIVNQRKGTTRKPGTSPYPALATKTPGKGEGPGTPAGNPKTSQVRQGTSPSSSGAKTTKARPMKAKPKEHRVSASKRTPRAIKRVSK